MTMALPRFADSDRGERGMHGRIRAADDAAMDVIPMLPAAAPDAMLRCECAACGAHVMVRRSWQIAGQCRNCRSYDIRALTAATPPASPPAVVDLAPRRPVALPARRVA
ncbi:MAG: hypothetical protein JWM73_837 [Solirubrobacterales bacterium]|nr:hypothetical protein [Solirubrobacterales bacterium]